MKNQLIKIFLVFSLTMLLTSQAITVQGEKNIVEVDGEQLAKLLVRRLKQFNLETPKNPSSDIAVLPGYPNAVFHVVASYEKNNTPIYVLSSITCYGKELVSYKQLSGRAAELSLDTVLIDSASSKYSDSLELFYTLVPSMSMGIPSGYYSVDKPVGFKELDIPQYPQIKFRLKPKLLAIFIGFSDGEYVRGPFYIYYYGFETTGTSYDGTFSRVTMVVSIVIDDSHILYRNYRALAGVVFYYSAYSVAPLSGSFPITTIYGFLGILAALVVSFIEYDEDYKFYVTLFIIFVLQIFLYVILNVLAGITLDVLYGTVLALGPWFVVLFLLWIAPYVFATYQYYSLREEPMHTSQGLAIMEGLGMSISLVFIALSIVFTRNIIDYIVTVSGPGGIYGFIAIIILVDMYIGYAIGRLWAVFSRYHETMTGPKFQ